MDKINFERIQLLIGGEPPIGLHEELFILGYKSGIGNEMLMMTILQISDIFEKLSKAEINYFIFGYALGQKTHIESEDEMLSNVNNNSKQFH